MKNVLTQHQQHAVVAVTSNVADHTDEITQAAIADLVAAGLSPAMIYGVLQGALMTTLGQAMTTAGFLSDEPATAPKPPKAPRKGAPRGSKAPSTALATTRKGKR